jgi:hypothetical protein
MNKYTFTFFAEKTEIVPMTIVVEAENQQDARERIREESEWSFEPQIGKATLPAQWETISSMTCLPKWEPSDDDPTQGQPGIDFPNYEEY